MAAHCTAAEDAATKVERQAGKSAAALLLEFRIGEKFDAIVTGASEEGTLLATLRHLRMSDPRGTRISKS